MYNNSQNVDLYPSLGGHDNYADAYFVSSWEDMALDATVSSVKSTDVTCKTHSGELAAQLPLLVNLASLVCHMDCWFSCRVPALWSLVRSQYTLLMRPNKVETAVQCFRMSCVSVRRIFWSW